MAVFYFDTSALLKRYVLESGSTWVRDLLQTRGERFYVLRLSRLESVAALSRRLLASPARMEEYATARRQLDWDWRNLFQIIELTPALIESSEELAERHRLRAYDALQLSAALFVREIAAPLEIEPVQLVSSDMELNQAAREEGLAVIAPGTLSSA